VKSFNWLVRISTKENLLFALHLHFIWRLSDNKLFSEQWNHGSSISPSGFLRGRNIEITQIYPIPYHKPICNFALQFIAVLETALGESGLPIFLFYFGQFLALLSI